MAKKPTYEELNQRIKKLEQKIADCIRTNEALRESEERYRDLYENAPNAFFSVNAIDESISGCNIAAMKLLGYDRGTLLRMKFIDLYADTPDGKFKAHEAFNAHKKGRSIRDIELQMKHNEGYPVWVSLTVEPVKDTYGNITESHSMAIDISERKHLEGKIIQAQRKEAIGTLAGGIAHDFNNILSAIMGYTDLEYLNANKDSKTRSNLYQVLKATKRAKNLIDQIFTFSRQTEQKPRPIEIYPIIKETHTLLRASLPTSIEINLNIKQESGTILADPAQIQQVLMNLCTNAAYAMKEKGGILEIILLDVEVNDEDVINFTNLSPGHYVKLSVSDTGYGIEPEVINSIFDPYFTTKGVGEGTGLGLAVVHGIVKSHGGIITVQSKIGKGTSFHIYLPKIERKTPYTPEVPGLLPHGIERILFVDDEITIAKLGKQILQLLGYEVTTHTDPIEAIETFRKNSDEFDLVITDLTMPNMTGDMLAKEIKNVRDDIPIILSTGYRELTNKEKTKSINISAYLIKPFVIRDLAQIVRNSLDKD